jgi:hypothetical protein
MKVSDYKRRIPSRVASMKLHGIRTHSEPNLLIPWAHEMEGRHHRRHASPPRREALAADLPFGWKASAISVRIFWWAILSASASWEQ